MKTVNFPTFFLLTTALCFGVAGCKKTPKSPTPIFGPGRTAPGGNNPGGIENAGPAIPSGNDTRSSSIPTNPDGTSPLASRPAGDLSNYLQDRDVFRQDTVYFEYDKYNVKAGELTKVQAVADYLKGQSNDAVLIEGHCDERGTPGYNDALGERRALSVRESLITLGINGERIHTVTFGENKPADPGHSENAYAKNRRGEFVLLRPK